MRVRLLGPLELELGGNAISLRGSRQRAVFALLAVRANDWVHRDTIIDQLWWNDPPRTARNSVQRFVSDLRAALGDDRDRIESAENSYRLRLAPGELDANEAERLLADGRRLRDGDRPRAASAYRSALDLWRGPALGDVTDVPIVDAERARLDELFLAATEEHMEVQLELGDHARHIPELSTVVRQHPFRERLWAIYVTALYRDGRQADALAAYEELRKQLLDELGLEPSRPLRDLQLQVLQQAPELSIDRGATDHTPNALARYELGEIIDRRDHAVVRRATLSAIEREVALTTFDPEIANEPEFIRRFERMLRLVATVDHPAVLPILDGWRDASGAYVVTAPYPGHTLSSVDPDRIDVREVLHRTGQGLAALHDAGVTHGAIRPEMVWIGVPEGTHGNDGVDGARLYSATFEAAPTDPNSDAVALFELARRWSLVPDRGLGGRTSITDVLALLGDSNGATPVVNPYKGLRAFEEADSEDFHGHDELIARITSTLGANRFTTVVGPSGSGKSSAVRAGLLPALRAGALPESDRWFIATMIPGASPFLQLATALADVAVDPPSDLVTRLAAEGGIGRVVDDVVPDDGEVLLVVDQFEEIFTQVVADRVRRRFLDGLVDAVTQPRSRLRVVATIRADFVDRPLATPRIGQLVEEGAVLVAPLGPQSLAQAIVAPASRRGVTFADGLPATIASDVWGQPAALPLLQHALRELFDARAGPVISLDDYAAIGGVRGALTKRADEVYDAFDPREREAVRQILLRLVTVGESGEPSRDRVERAALPGADLDGATVNNVLDELGDRRLVTFDRDPVTREPTVTVAHEALLSEWDRLACWIDESRSEMMTQRRVTAAAREWSENDRDPSFLAAGTQLAQFVEWTGSASLGVGAVEAAFMASSSEAACERERSANERAAREAALEDRSGRRLRALVAVMAVAVVVAVALSAIAVNRSREASDRRAEAEHAAAASLRQGLVASARSELSNDPELALLLAIEAADLADEASEPYGSELVDVLHLGLAEHRLTATIDDAVSARFLPDDRIIVGAVAGRIRLVDVDGHPIAESRRGHDGPVADLDVSADGSIAVSVGADGSIRIWDVETVSQLVALPGEATGAKIRPDGGVVATASTGGRLTLWNVKTGRQLADRQAGRGGSADLPFAWTPDGNLLFAAVGGGDLRLVELDGTTLQPATDSAADLSADEFADPPCELAIDPATGNTTIGRPGLPTAIVGRDGREREGLGGIAGCALAATETAVAIGGEDSTIILVRPEEGRPLADLRGHTAAVTTLSFSGDGTRLVSAAADGTARVWDVTQDRTVELSSIDIGAFGVEGRVGHVVWSPDGTTVTMSSASQAIVVDAGDELAERDRFGVLASVGLLGIAVDARTAVDSRGELMAVGTSPSGSVEIIDLDTGEVVAQLDPPASTSSVMGVGFDRTGDRLVGVSIDGDVTIWDMPTARASSSFSLTGEGPYIEALFAPDESSVIMISLTGEIEVHDAISGELRRSFRHGGPVIDAVSTPEADILVTAGVDGIIRVWDPSAGEELRSWSTSATLTSLGLTADGLRLFAASTDGVVTEWDTISGSLRSTPAQFVGRIVVGVDPDGSRLLIGTTQGLQLLTTAPSELLSLAGARITRRLRPDECRRFIPSLDCPN